MPPRNASSYRPARLFLLAAVLWVLSPVSPAPARSASKDFRRAFKRSTSPEAFRRAEQRLDSTRPGMNQAEFFSVMELQLLSRNGRTVAATVDGYLGPDSSSSLLEGDADRARGLLFGYREGKQKVPRVLVIFHGEQLIEVRRLGSVHPSQDNYRPCDPSPSERGSVR